MNNKDQDKSLKEPIFISFEGIDGSGKSTHIESLVAVFKAVYGEDNVTQSREPGGTLLAEKLRHIILNDSMDALTESLLVFAARRDHLKSVIGPALARGAVVLCDRFNDATFAYQGGGRGFDLDTLLHLEKITQEIQVLEQNFPLAEPAIVEKVGHNFDQPSLTIWFDIPPEVAADRIAHVRIPDKFESQSVDFFRLVIAGYQQRMDHDPQRFVKINANQSRDAVWADVLNAVKAKGYLR